MTDWVENFLNKMNFTEAMWIGILIGAFLGGLSLLGVLLK